MSVVAHLPATKRGQRLSLAAVAALWVLAYGINGRVWDTLFYDVLGMAPDDRLTSSLHFFFYDTVKICLLLSGIIFVISSPSRPRPQNSTRVR